MGLRIAICTLTVVAACTIVASADGRKSSSVTLSEFSLEPAGVSFTMHPSAARIVLAARASAMLEVCQSGTSFAGSWSGGCRRMAHGRLALPSSGGLLHVSFRVVPLLRQTTPVASLVIRWHCIDHAFALDAGATRVRGEGATFDC